MVQLAKSVLGCQSSGSSLRKGRVHQHANAVIRASNTTGPTSTVALNGLPRPPNLEGANPCSKFNAVTLAYLGDAIYEALLRQYVIKHAREGCQGTLEPGALFQASSRESTATRQAQHYDALLTAYTAAQQPPPGAQAQAGFSNSATALSTAQHTTNKCTHLVPQLVRVNVSGEEKAQLRTTRPRKGFGGGTAHSKAAKSQVSLSRRELSTPAHAPPFPDAAKGDSISLSNPIQNVCATEAHASITVAQTAPSSPQSQGGMDGQGQSSQLDHRNLPDSDDGIKAEHTAMRDEERRAGGWSGPEFRLTEKERDVLRWGHNAHGLTPPDKIDMRLYKKATALEVLVAYLYISNSTRCVALCNTLFAMKKSTV